MVGGAAEVVGGRLIFNGEFTVGLHILGAALQRPVTNGRVRLDLAPDGSAAVRHLTGGLSVFIYLCHMSIVLTGLYFAMGTIGFAASGWFVYKIFRAVKHD